LLTICGKVDPAERLGMLAAGVPIGVRPLGLPARGREPDIKKAPFPAPFANGMLAAGAPVAYGHSAYPLATVNPA